MGVQWPFAPPALQPIVRLELAGRRAEVCRRSAGLAGHIDGGGALAEPQGESATGVRRRQEPALAIDRVGLHRARGPGQWCARARTLGRALESGELVAITTRHRALTNSISLVRLLDRVPGRLEREFVSFVTKALARARS